MHILLDNKFRSRPLQNSDDSHFGFGFLFWISTWNSSQLNYQPGPTYLLTNYKSIHRLHKYNETARSGITVVLKHIFVATYESASAVRYY
jgi:hypothetical protein